MEKTLISLPSKRLPYGEKVTDVSLSPFSGREEMLIAEITNDNFYKKFVTVFKNVLTGIDPIDLTVGDMLYLLIWEAINSFSKEYKVTYTCSTCLTTNEAVIDLSKFEKIELPDSYKEPYAITLSDGKVLNLRLQRVSDEIKIVDYEKNQQNSWMFRYALTIVDGEKKTMDIVEKMEYLKSLSTKDTSMIRAFQEEFKHGLDMRQNCTCKNCDALELVACPFQLDMVFPFGSGLKKYFRA